MDFNRFLNWQLLRGSHEFPGPNGGTCFLEAAVVAAGHEYRPVKNAFDLPPSFCPYISAYALAINDSTYVDSERQKLIRYVGMMDGTRAYPPTRAVHLILNGLGRITGSHYAEDYLYDYAVEGLIRSETQLANSKLEEKGRQRRLVVPTMDVYHSYDYHLPISLKYEEVGYSIDPLLTILADAIDMARGFRHEPSSLPRKKTCQTQELLPTS